MLETRRPDVGIMLNTNAGTAREHLAAGPWAVENGGYTSATFDAGPWLSHLEARLAQYLPTCLFAIAPDVLGDPVETRRRSRPVIPRLQALGFPVAYVAQPGCTASEVPWEEIACLFAGGDRRWKADAAMFALVDLARDRGKWVHFGAVNSWRYIQALAAAGGVDSVDGTHLKFDPVRGYGRVTQWMDRLKHQHRLGLFR